MSDMTQFVELIIVLYVDSLNTIYIRVYTYDDYVVCFLSCCTLRFQIATKKYWNYF